MVYRVQGSPTCTFCALSAENLSRILALLAFVDLNLGDCTAYGLQRQVGVPVCTAGAGKVLLKRGSCILMYSLVMWMDYVKGKSLPASWLPHEVLSVHFLFAV